MGVSPANWVGMILLFVVMSFHQVMMVDVTALEVYPVRAGFCHSFYWWSDHKLLNFNIRSDFKWLTMQMYLLIT